MINTGGTQARSSYTRLKSYNDAEDILRYQNGSGNGNSYFNPQLSSGLNMSE